MKLALATAGTLACVGGPAVGARTGAYYFGQHYQVIDQVCDSAGACEGGMLRLARSSHTSPEAFIKAHRKALAKAAVGIQGAKERGLEINGRIQVKAKGGDSSDKHRMKELSKVKTPTPPDSFGYVEFTFDLTKPDELKLWSNNVPLPAHRACEVIGPGERDQW
jgi:hypothetical protein